MVLVEAITQNQPASFRFPGRQFGKDKNVVVYSMLTGSTNGCNCITLRKVTTLYDTEKPVLELMFRSVSFLGKKGMAFWGDSTSDDVLMLERTYNLSRKRQWIERRDNRNDPE